jgi:mono/diheme cytochrome c family protein
MREWTAADHAQPRDPAPERMGQPAGEEPSGEAAELRAARALFAASCASCHGRDARGLGEARPPGAQMPDMTSAAFHTARSDRQLAQVIREGRGMMPGFSKQITDAGVNALVHYIRTLSESKADAGK